QRKGKNGPVVRLTEQYQRPPHADVGRWPVVPYRDHAPENAIAWAAVGATTFGSPVVVIDRYRLHHSGGLVLPILHIHRRDARSNRIVLDFGLSGKAGPAEW